mgnify:CR=1 FL=1
MGYFSFLTADTKKSIRLSDMPRAKSVYMLMPGNQPNVIEESYEGYGIFGGIDCYSWLAEANFPGYSDRDLGICAFFGEVYKINGKHYAPLFSFWNAFHDKLISELVSDLNPHRVVSMNAEIDELNGLSLQQAINSNKFSKDIEVIKVIDLLKYPLKFSFKKSAVYEKLAASERCPKQGC